MSYLPPNAGRMNVTFGGNTAGAAATVSTGTLGLHGGNNVTLSQNGNNVTISGGGGGGAAFSAGTQSVNTGTVNFANSNGVTFGMSGSSQITASHNGLTSQSNQVLSASNGSFAFQTAAFEDANGVTFGTSAGSVISASVNTSYAGSNHSHGNPTLNLTNLSGTTASASNGLTLSLSAASQTVQTQSRFNLSVGGNSTSAGAGYINISSGQMLMAGGDNITLSQNGNSVSILGGAGAGGGIALANSQTTYTSGTAHLVGDGDVTVYSAANQSLRVSIPATSSLSATGAFSIATNGGTISMGVPAFSAGMSSSTYGGATGGTSGTASNQVVIAAGSNITLSQSTGVGGNTLAIHGPSGGGAGLSAGTQSINTGTVVFSNSNGITFGMSGSSRITASHNGITSQTAQTANLYVSSNSTQLSSTAGVDLRSLSFQGAGNVSIGVSQGRVLISGAGGGGGIAFANSETTYSSGTVNLVGDGPATVYSAANQSYRVSIPGTSSLSAVPPFGITTNGATISMGGPSFAVSASNSVFTSGTIKLTNAGGAITVGTAAQEINFSVPATSSLSATGAVSISTNGSTISIGAPAQTVQTQNRFNLVASGNTAGVMAEISSGTMTLAGGNGVTLSQNGNALTIAAGGGGVVGSYFDNMLQANASNSAGQAISYSSVSTGLYNRLILQPLTPANELFPFNISAGTMLFNFSNNSSNNMTGAHSSTWYFGLYTRVNSTQLSLLNSASVSYGMSANAGNTVSYMGARWLSVHSSLFSSAPNFVGGSRYFFGLFARTSGSTYPQISIAGMHFGQSVQRSGMMGTASSGNSTFNAWHPFMGVHSNTTITALPASIGNAEIIKASVYANFIPHVVLDAGLGVVN